MASASLTISEQDYLKSIYEPADGNPVTTNAIAARLSLQALSPVGMQKMATVGPRRDLQEASVS
jgi:Mn-dependent DtxR family transcriptional regulator